MNKRPALLLVLAAAALGTVGCASPPTSDGEGESTAAITGSGVNDLTACTGHSDRKEIIAAIKSVMQREFAKQMPDLVVTYLNAESKDDADGRWAMAEFTLAGVTSGQKYDALLAPDYRQQEHLVAKKIAFSALLTQSPGGEWTVFREQIDKIEPGVDLESAELVTIDDGSRPPPAALFKGKNYGTFDATQRTTCRVEGETATKTSTGVVNGTYAYAGHGELAISESTSERFVVTMAGIRAAVDLVEMPTGPGGSGSFDVDCDFTIAQTGPDTVALELDPNANCFHVGGGRSIEGEYKRKR